VTPTPRSPEPLPEPHPSVVFREVDDGAVLLHTDSEIYFGLNPVGSHVWRRLPPECSDLEELTARLRERYPDVESEAIRKDVTELLGHLEEEGLVVS